MRAFRAFLLHSPENIFRNGTLNRAELPKTGYANCSFIKYKDLVYIIWSYSSKIVPKLPFQLDLHKIELFSILAKLRDLLVLIPKLCQRIMIELIDLNHLYSLP